MAKTEGNRLNWDGFKKTPAYSFAKKVRTKKDYP